MVTEEIYPMPSFPTLIVKDLEASSDFYQNAPDSNTFSLCRVLAGSMRWSICDR
jgi:hypothetical protein